MQQFQNIKLRYLSEMALFDNCYTPKWVFTFTLGNNYLLRYNFKMDFEIIGSIRQPETFARGSAIRELPRLRKIYGQGNWRKRKGFATVRLQDGSLREAEIHWY